VSGEVDDARVAHHEARRQGVHRVDVALRSNELIKEATLTSGRSADALEYLTIKIEDAA
jgi:hypothetical protein